MVLWTAPDSCGRLVEIALKGTMILGSKGRCLCGSIEFDVAFPTKWCAHCHCSLCRRAHGAGFVTWFGVATSQFSVTKGHDKLKWYASSPQANRGFCMKCGTTMFFSSLRWSDEMHIALAVMTSDIDREPAAHVFVDDRVDWVSLDDQLKHFGGLSGTEPVDQ